VSAHLVVGDDPVLRDTALRALVDGKLHSRVPATILIAVGAFVATLGDTLNRFGMTEWFQLGKFLGVLFLFAGFLVWETRTDHPMLPLALFRRRNFAIGNVETFSMYAGLGLLFFFLVLYLQQVAGYSALEAGRRVDAPGDVTGLVIRLPRGGEVSGTVRDGLGNPVAGAAVRIENCQYGCPREATSDASGDYRISLEGALLPKASRIAREDVAALVLKSLETDTYHRRAVVIAQ